MNRYFISPLDERIALAVEKEWDNKVKPKDSLGYLEELVGKIVSIREKSPVAEMKATLLLCAGDHHIVEEGVSHSPQKITWQQIENFAHGGGAVSMMSNDQKVHLEIIDCGVNHDFDKTLKIIDKKVSYGANNFLYEKALEPKLALQAIENGKELVRMQCEQGYEIIMVGEMGIGNTTSASALCASLLSIAPSLCTSKGGGLTSSQLLHKIEVVQRALAFHTEVVTPFDALCAFGGYEIATLVGIMLEAAHQRRVIIIDGFVTSCALLVASMMEPHLVSYVIASHVGKEKGHSLILEKLSLRPLLSLDLSLGEGSGALLCWPIIKQALHLYDGMETFDEAHVTNSVEKLMKDCKEEQL